MHKKQPLSDHSLTDLLQEAKSNTGIFQEFCKKAEDTHQMLAREFAGNLGTYLDYADIFTDDPHHARDLVQQSFMRALENTEDFDTCFSQSKDPQIVIMSYIQEELEKQKNTLFLITRKILENTKDDDCEQSPIEAIHQINIEEEIARAFMDLNDDDQNKLLNFMTPLNNSELPEDLREKLKKNEKLRELYKNSNSPDLS